MASGAVTKADASADSCDTVREMNMGWAELLELLHQGRLTVYPLGVLSVLVFSLALERAWRFRGVERATRALVAELLPLLLARNFDEARALCARAPTPMAAVFGEGLRWRGIALEDLNAVLATARLEMLAGLRRGLWFIGTTGSLAPYIGLLGTVVGIMQAFGAIAASGDAGFEVVSAGISEALIATAIGLLVAIVALMLFNALQTKLASITSTCARASERFVQGLLWEAADGGRDNDGG